VEYEPALCCAKARQLMNLSWTAYSEYVSKAEEKLVAYKTRSILSLDTHNDDNPGTICCTRCLASWTEIASFPAQTVGEVRELSHFRTTPTASGYKQVAVSSALMTYRVQLMTALIERKHHRRSR